MPIDASNRSVVGAQTVAEMFSVSPKTVTRWATEGRIPHFLTFGGHRRFYVDEIEKLLKQREREVVSPAEAEASDTVQAGSVTKTAGDWGSAVLWTSWDRVANKLVCVAPDNLATYAPRRDSLLPRAMFFIAGEGRLDVGFEGDTSAYSRVVAPGMYLLVPSAVSCQVQALPGTEELTFLVQEFDAR